MNPAFQGSWGCFENALEAWIGTWSRPRETLKSGVSLFRDTGRGSLSNDCCRRHQREISLDGSLPALGIVVVETAGPANMEMASVMTWGLAASACQEDVRRMALFNKGAERGQATFGLTGSEALGAQAQAGGLHRTSSESVPRSSFAQRAPNYAELSMSFFTSRFEVSLSAACGAFLGTRD